MNYELRLHHLMAWYEQLYEMDEIDRQLWEREFNEAEGDQREYIQYCMEGVQEIGSFSPHDLITIVQNKDVICSRCPKPQNEGCHRFDPHNSLTRRMGLRVGESYTVGHILRLFEVFHHVSGRQMYSLDEKVNLYAHLEDLIKATFLGLHQDIKGNMKDLQCIGKAIGLTLPEEDEDSQRDYLERIATYVESSLHKSALEHQHPRVKEKLKSIWSETRPLVVRNLAQSLLDGDYGLWQAPTRGKDHRVDLACYLSSRGSDIVQTILTCDNLNDLLKDDDFTTVLASAHEMYSERVTAVDERLEYKA